MKKRKILLSLFGLLLALPMMAIIDKANALVVWTKDGAKTTYVLLNKKPQLMISGTDLLIAFVGENIPPSEWSFTSIPLANVQRFTYEQVDDPDAISAPQSDSSPVSYQNDGTIIIGNVEAGQPVGIYSLDGKLLQQLPPQTSGNYRLSLSGLTPGVYILKAGKLTTKITKR
ncbi:MAG: T9SS type A sorting domain-containing protein [Bacteroidaceae bacterium]|nr:T9SS type A sorting domain-containing protein [Bacteroidaceae bacterium]